MIDFNPALWVLRPALFIIFNLIFNPSTLAQTEKDEIHIYNDSREQAYFSYVDEFNDFVSINIAANRSITLKVITPIIISSSTYLQEPFLFFSGDSVKLSIDKNKGYSLVSKSVEKSMQLNLLVDIKKSLDSGKHGYKSLGDMKKEGEMLKHPLKRDSILFSNYDKELKFLTQYNKFYFSDDFETYVKNYLQYKYLSEISKHLLLKSVEGNSSKAYIDSLVNLKKYLVCSDCLEIKTYRAFAITYLSYIEIAHPLDNKIEYVSEKFIGTTKDFLLFSLMKNCYSSNLKLFKSTYQQFLGACGNIEFKNYITKLYEFESNRLRYLGKELLDSNNSLISFSDLLHKYKNKIVYIDFWASWCNPCLEEMEFSETLMKKYKSVDIVWLYFSLDKNKNNWETTAKRIGIKSENNFLVIGGFDSQLLKDFKIKSIPHYILFDKNNKIFNINAPRPSEKE